MDDAYVAEYKEVDSSSEWHSDGCFRLDHQICEEYIRYLLPGVSYRMRVLNYERSIDGDLLNVSSEVIVQTTALPLGG